MTAPDPTAAAAPAWQQRFRASAILFSAIAIDAPRVGLVTSNASGVPQLYRWDPEDGSLSQLTFDPGGRIFGRLSPDGRWVTWLADTGGNEIGHWVVIASDGGEAVDLSPHLAPYASEQIAFSRYGGHVGFITASDDRLAVRVATIGADGAVGELRTVHHSTADLTALALSADGKLAAFSSAHRSTGLEHSLLTTGTQTGEPGPELWDGPGTGIQVFAFAPGRGDRRLAATTNASGRERAFVWDAGSGVRQDLPADAPAGDLLPLDWAPDGTELLLCQIDEAEQRLVLWNLAADTIRPLDHPPGAVLSYSRAMASYFRPDGREIVCRWEDFGQPRRLIGLDPQTGRQTRTILASGEVPPGHAFRSISFPTTDGTARLQAWLGVPAGDAPSPVILETHGGPTAATFRNFHAQAQAFVDAGYAFLSLNYRGSTTFGREFEHAIWGRLGELEIEDLAAARTWLVDNGVAIPDQILLTGWSYGGFLTLLGLGRQPDLWAGGMAGVAIADWIMNYEDSSDLLRSYQRMLFGGSPDEQGEAMRTGSPMTYVDEVVAPVLIIQGRNDTRTPARPIERYVERLDARGHPVDIEWFDAGHMGGDDEESIHHQALMLDFASRVLAGPAANRG
jgi:dipeptidyl aminopeptidase/acylaminoacyl peptidase